MKLSILCMLGFTIAAPLFLTGAHAQDAPGQDAPKPDAPRQEAPKEPRKDTAIEPTSWGHITGQIYDASTQDPLAGARITVRHDGTYATGGKTTGRTDALGRYECQAMLGRVSSNFDVSRALFVGVMGLATGMATNTTKRIDVSRITVRVEREGYHTYEGTVLCRRVDADRFSALMEPILLTPDAVTDASTSADGWGAVRVREVSVTPAVLKPGDHAVITVRVLSPPVGRGHDLKVACFSRLWGRRELHEERDTQQNGILTYSGRADVSRRQKGYAGDLLAVVEVCPYDIGAPGSALSARFQDVKERKPQDLDAIYADESEEAVAAVRAQSGLLQVAASTGEEALAARRSEAYLALQSGDDAGAARGFREVCGIDGASDWDFERLADACNALHDWSGASAALKRAGELAPEKQRMRLMGEYAAALVSGGQPAQVLSECAPAATAVPEGEREKRVPIRLMVAIGESYVDTGQLADAAKMRKELEKWRNEAGYAGITRFRNALRLAEARAAVTASPGSAAAQADYARVLIDQGRWQEAEAGLRAAAKAIPDQPVLIRDLAYVELHLPGASARTGLNYDAAIAAAHKLAAPADAHGKTNASKEFFAWHALAMLLYAKASDLKQAGDPGAPEILRQTHDALVNALKCGRAGATVYGSSYSLMAGYRAKRRVTIAGFAYPEADNDFLILESLTALQVRPDDALALTDLGGALLDLGEPALAAAPIRRALTLQPNLVEAQYVDALVDAQSGDHAAARLKLKAVLQANPRHPHANLTLAHLYTDDGDAASAAECMAAHARYYGNGQDASKP